MHLPRRRTSVNPQLSLYDALVSVSIPPEKARAVVAALEQEMTTVLATKSDLEQLRVATRSDMEHLRALLEQRIDHQGTVVTVRVGGIIFAGMTALLSLLFAALRLTGAAG